MYYTYILKSLRDLSFYIGSTKDLEKRIKEHNQGSTKYSSTKAPFELIWYGAFKTKQLAQNFERYLKGSSGFAFRNKHLV